jgi:hypothetical protein
MLPVDSTTAAAPTTTFRRVYSANDTSFHVYKNVFILNGWYHSSDSCKVR